MEEAHAGGRAGLRILVAEDHPVNQMLIKRLLERRGHAVTLAGNGRLALECMEKCAFDLLLLDVQMPELDAVLERHSIARTQAAAAPAQSR